MISSAVKFLASSMSLVSMPAAFCMLMISSMSWIGFSRLTCRRAEAYDFDDMNISPNFLVRSVSRSCFFVRSLSGRYDLTS